MNKTLRILIMFFSAFCFAVLVVFCVQLFLQNRGVERAEMHVPAVIEQNQNDEQQDNDEEYEPAPEDDPPPDEPDEPEPNLQRHEIEMPGREFILSLYADENNFVHSYSEIVDLFTYQGDSAAFLKIQMVLIPEDSENFAIDFMETQFDVHAVPDGRFFEDERYLYIAISESGLSGIYAIAIIEDEARYETWILAIPYTPNFGVALTIHYRENAQLAALEEILNTLELLPRDDIED